MYHWTVRSWLCGEGRRMHEFAVAVDSTFLSTARSVEFDSGAIQKHARVLASEAGYKVSEHDQLLDIGEYGIEQVNVPGCGGRWLHLSKISINGKGAIYETHNIDHSNQQAYLMAVWVWWADHVSSRIQK